ncbi:MAG: hypothetical protein D6737_08325, partial [Chloroflexi bacterium]
MTDDLQIIAALERELNIELRRYESLEAFVNLRRRKYAQGYVTNEDDAVVALALEQIDLEVIPHTIFQLANLTHLYLSANQLSALPPEVGQLANLTHLY